MSTLFFLAETGKIIKPRIAQISGGQPFGVSGTANRTTLLATESFSAAHITLRFAFMMTLQRDPDALRQGRFKEP